MKLKNCVAYLNADDFVERIDGVLTRLTGQFFVTHRERFVAEKGPHALVRSVANGWQIVAALEGHDDPTAGQFHQLARHVTETGGRHLVTAQLRRVTRCRVETRRHENNFRFKFLLINSTQKQSIDD